jgi:hypothetical protein
MTALERRCRWLLRAYPASYRAEHGDELLGTMLEAVSPDRAWPGWRESSSVVLGGIRARSAQNHRPPGWANIRLAVMLALATYLFLTAATYVRQLIVLWSFGSPGWDDGLRPIWILGAVALVIVILAWFARRAVAGPAMLAAGAAWLVLERGFIIALALACLAVLTMLREERMPRSWLWWAAAPPVWLVAAPLLGHAHLAGVSVNVLVAVAFVLVTVVWATVDARPAFALAVLLGLVGVVALVTSYYLVGSEIVSATYVGAGVMAALPLLLRSRHRAAL